MLSNSTHLPILPTRPPMLLRIQIRHHIQLPDNPQGSSNNLTVILPIQDNPQDLSSNHTLIQTLHLRVTLVIHKGVILHLSKVDIRREVIRLRVDILRTLTLLILSLRTLPIGEERKS